MAARNSGRPESGDTEYPAGAAAPASAAYESVNLFGRRTGHRITVRQGEILPVLPRGFNWVIVERWDDSTP
ncbi:MAG TPA: hypothetical protein VMB34_08955 [Acetobacteraceae bacterium]|nr:hypothetical protein [Acetobacteraceae bacterium]